MNAEQITKVRELVEKGGFRAAPPLTDAELIELREHLGLRFPGELESLLKSFLPEGPEFPDWHRPDTQQLLDWLDEPAAGIEHEVEENGFWLPQWGERPEDDEDAVEEVRRLIARAPALVPVFDHCYVPAMDRDGGNPVLSVVEAEVIEYAPDLFSFFLREFGGAGPALRGAAGIPFWSDLVRANEA